jgi:GntR family transcriptional regulator/MocR family aminotransferase
MTGPVLRPWGMNMPLRLDRGSREPIYKQLERQLTEEIRFGRLSAGMALPSSRELAAALGINRKTVVLAYDNLVARGVLRSSPMRAVFVSDPEAGRGAVATPLSADMRTLERRYEMASDAGMIPMVLSGGPVGSFDDGLPDARILPARALGRAYRSTLVEEAHHNRLSYGDPKGHPRLREAIVRLVNAERGLSIEVDNVCITRGSQMAILLATRILANPGDTVAMDELTYPPAYFAFTSMGCNVVPVRTDGNGFDVDHLEQICRRHRVKTVYLTPHHQFPTTVTLSPERRLRLLAIAEQFGFSVIEDDYDHDYNFDAKALLPMARFSSSKVVYIGSFSKILSPHLRLGFVVALKETIDAFSKLVLLFDRQGDQIGELAIAQVIENGELARHARRALALYRTRRDAFAGALDDIFKDRIGYSRPAGGLAFWIEFKDERDILRIDRRAPELGLRLLLSQQFRLSDGARRGLRLGFASKTEAEAIASLRIIRSLIDP